MYFRGLNNNPRMIRKCIIALLFIFSLANAIAQSAREQFEQRKDVFLNNNIYVVYEGNAVLDSALKEGFSKFWTLKPISGFVTEKEAKKLIPDEHNSFIYVSHVSWTESRSSSGGRSTAAIFAFNGGKKNRDKYKLREESASATHFDYFCNEKEFDKAAYRLPLMVADLQYDLNLKYDTVTVVPFNKRKVLIVNKDAMQGSGRRAGIRKDAMSAWPWKYEVKSAEEIGQLIRSRDNRYILLTSLLSDDGAVIKLHDLESMKKVALASRMAVMGLPWVRVKEMEKLVEKIQ